MVAPAVRGVHTVRHVPPRYLGGSASRSVGLPGGRSRDPRPGATRRITTGVTREGAKLRERLARIQDDLKRVRATERVLREQVAYLAEVRDDAETRKLVAQTPLADREWQAAFDDHRRHARLLDEARTEADALASERDRLLDRLLDLEGSP